MKVIEGKWGYFSPAFGLKFMVLRGSYFDSRYALYFAFIWGVFNIKLPFKTRLAEGCDLPRYGFDIHNATLWLYWGGTFDSSIGQMKKENLFTWNFPFFTMVYDSTHTKDEDGNWRLVGSNEYSDDVAVWARTISVPYTYVLRSGEEQHVTALCYEEKRQWHHKWFPFLKKIEESIDVKFSDEVGERSGSWKGGVLGCGYGIRKGETALDCIRRMESEREFT